MFSSLQRISVIMQDGSAANQSVCLWERSLPSEKHWTVLHSIKPRCDVKCKVGCWAGLRHPLSVFFCLCGAQLYQTKGFFFFFFYCRTKHPQTRHTELRGSTLYSSPTMFVCVQRKTGVSSGLRCDPPVPISAVVVVFGAGLRFEELTGSTAGLPFRLRSREAFPVMALWCQGGLCGYG